MECHAVSWIRSEFSCSAPFHSIITALSFYSALFFRCFGRYCACCTSHVATIMRYTPFSCGLDSLFLSYTQSITICFQPKGPHCVRTWANQRLIYTGKILGYVATEQNGSFDNFNPTAFGGMRAHEIRAFFVQLWTYKLKMQSMSLNKTWPSPNEKISLTLIDLSRVDHPIIEPRRWMASSPPVVLPWSLPKRKNFQLEDWLLRDSDCR